MIWNKNGLILSANDFSDSLTHTVLPFINWSEVERSYFLYYSSRNHQNHASTYRMKISFSGGIQVEHSSRELVLSPGDIGFFDQHGAIGSSIIEVNGLNYLYYIGWTQGHESPLFYASVGLAISKDYGLTYEKHSNAPFIPRSRENPLLMTSPHIFKDGEDLYRMVYISGVKWKKVNGKLLSYYRICSAKSNNGLDWFEMGKVLIDFDIGETHFARPWVLKCGEIYVLFYSFKGSKHDYRLGMATSTDFVEWKRCDNKISINFGEEGDFDCEMMCYPSISVLEDTLYLFYNGNRFGRDGIGYLTAELSDLYELINYG